MALRECPPTPYVPEKDSVQEMVSSFKEAHLKTLIKEGTELRVPIWHSGTREAFLLVSTRSTLTTLVTLVSILSYLSQCPDVPYYS
jgi:hypothetical protein